MSMTLSGVCCCPAASSHLPGRHANLRSAAISLLVSPHLSKTQTEQKTKQHQLKAGLANPLLDCWPMVRNLQ